jgi:two-component sensor histidine kinase
MAVLRGPEHVYELANESHIDFIGRAEIFGKSVKAVLPELEEQGFIKLLDEVYASGKPLVGRRLPLQIRTPATGHAEQRYIDFVFQPVRDADGAVSGIFVQGSDVTDQVRGEEQQQLLIRELHHRVKNTLATVQAILGSTARSSLSIADFHEAFSGRLMALAKTHSILTDNDRQVVTVLELLQLELEPYDDASGRRVKLAGPDIGLPVKLAVPVGMAIHELTTNAAKYGALSDLGGVLSVTWQIEGAGAERSLRLEWVEANGPPVSPPTREGFGSRLLNKALATQAGAKVEMKFALEGLRATVLLPIDGEAV